MFRYVVGFFVIALIASLLGFGGVAGLSADFGWAFAVVATILFAFLALTGRRRSRGLTLP